jgi:predicted nucleic acid-binding protein
MDIIPDSTFFICFFDDLNGIIDPNTLDSYFSVFTTNFDIKIPSLVNEEITRTNYDLYNKHSSSFNVVATDNLSLNDSYLLELLRPLVGKGEFEVITFAKYYQECGLDNFIFILDDNQARSKINSYFHELKGHLKGTVGLVMFCCLDMCILDKNESLKLLYSIKNSKFYVASNIIENVIYTIETH